MVPPATAVRVGADGSPAGTAVQVPPAETATAAADGGRRRVASGIPSLCGCAGSVLAVYWLATAIAARGVAAFTRIAKWGGIVGTIIPAAALITIGFAYLISGGTPQVRLDWDDAIPDLSNLSNLALAASIFHFYSGMEMNAVHVQDIKNPDRGYPLAILIAALGTAAILILGTLTIAFVVPRNETGSTQSPLITFIDVFDWFGLSWATPILTCALAIGVLAGIVTCVAGPSTALHAVAKAGYLPPFYQAANKTGCPSESCWFRRSRSAPWRWCSSSCRRWRRPSRSSASSPGSSIWSST